MAADRSGQAGAADSRDGRTWRVVCNGKVPLDEVVRAHTMMEKNEQIGKIVLTMELIVC